MNAEKIELLNSIKEKWNSTLSDDDDISKDEVLDAIQHEIDSLK